MANIDTALLRGSAITNLEFRGVPLPSPKLDQWGALHGLENGFTKAYPNASKTDLTADFRLHLTLPSSLAKCSITNLEFRT